ncbi:PLP-dependent aminotransferase family protein [Dactylosporangium sp. NPDC050688]|uniref:MocR-like pyridoxine biosynthesis transcription factor PdxR n=1 Tax=Dactylosporangium sp. NPDC050688 TaxID=3157217 RepID=UPI0033FF6012
MDVHVSLVGREDLAGQIYQQIRAAILAGRLGAGAPLPSTRELASRLAVARNTVSSAYDRLTAEGFLSSRAGVGTYVSVSAAQLDPPALAEFTDEPVPRPRAWWDAVPRPPDLSARPAEFDFRPGMPDAGLFPYATWRALLAGEVRGSATRTSAYGEPAGHPALRAAIARHVGLSRAVTATADAVLVTGGAQQAVDLIGRVLLEPGDTVAVEDPGYPPPRLAFTSLGANVVAVPVDSEGLVVDALPARARLVYVTPSHQFPLGHPMSLARRLALLAWARRSGAVIIEDDYDSEFRYTGRPLEPLHNLDQGRRVVYIGSFSKILLPTLRLGFCVAPPSLQNALRTAKFLADWHSPGPIQSALATFIDRGLLARHVRRMRRIYQGRRERLLACLSRDFTGRLAPIDAPAGLHLTAWLHPAVPGADRDLVRAAAAAGFRVSALSNYAVAEPPPQGIVFGYGLVEVDRIDEGLARLRQMFD